MELNSVGEFFGQFLDLKPNEYLELVLIVYGLYIGSHHLWEIIADYVEIRENPYRVKTTMVKDLVSNNRTERTKLRQLRVRKTCDSLQTDPLPEIAPYRVRVSSYHSLPGIANIFHRGTRFFVVGLGPDEKLKPHRDHSVLLSYTMEESIETLFDPNPEFIARQPAGKNRLVYEVHLPPEWRYRRESGSNNPQIEVQLIVKDETNRNGVSKRPLKRERWFGKRWEVVGGRESWPNYPEHDWFRVSIKKPPRKGEGIRIGWFWDDRPKRQS